MAAWFNHCSLGLCPWIRHFTPLIPLDSGVIEYQLKVGSKACDRLASCPGGDQVSSIPLNATETGISSGSMGLEAWKELYFT